MPDQQEKFDLCVIGAGPAGYAAAMRAVDFKKKVVLVERDKIGGAGIYNGALTSKTLWELSTQIANSNKRIKEMGMGDTIQDTIPYDEVQNVIAEAVFERKFQLQCHIKLLQTEAYKKYFSYERGTARMLNRN
jgi:dihydrolipoamide dehydrogenase